MICTQPLVDLFSLDTGCAQVQLALSAIERCDLSRDTADILRYAKIAIAANHKTEILDRSVDRIILHACMVAPKPVGQGIGTVAIARAEKDAIDILLPLGPGSKFGNIELQHAIRSIEKHAVGWRRVYVVGAVPGWLQESERIKPVHRKEYRHNKATRISRKVLWSFENLPITDKVAFWNDDYFLLSSIDVRQIPPHYRGTLHRRSAGRWAKTLQGTADALQSAGLTARNYDIHVPMLLEHDKFCSLGKWWYRSRSAPAMGYVMKSIYGNHFCNAQASPTRDCKLQSCWTPRMIEALRQRGRWVISYGDAALRAGLGRWLDEADAA